MDQEKIEIMKSAGIDYDTAIDRFGGNDAMYEKFVRRYADNTHYQELIDAFDENNSESAYKVAHSLKGVVGNLSFSDYYEAITPLTQFLREGKMEEARAMLPQLEQEQERICKALAEL